MILLSILICAIIGLLGMVSILVIAHYIDKAELEARNKITSCSRRSF